MKELTFSHINMNCYQPIHQCVHVQEETQEAIVPDACPDILRVVERCGRVCLRATQAREGNASVTGVIITTVLYQPEGESGIRRMEVTVPFDCTITVPELTPSDSLVVKTRLRGVDARVLNPRKVVVRAEIALSLSAYTQRTIMICNGVESNGQTALQEKKTEQKAYIVSAVQVKPFSYTEQVRLSGQSDTSEVMTIRAQPICAESKQIGNKLVLKGDVLMQLLVREPAGGLVASEHSLPFSQIMELPNVGEAGDCTVTLELVQLNLLSSSDESKQMDVQVELLAQAVVCEHTTVTRLEDIYSTGYEMETTREIHAITAFIDRASSTQNLRELLEVDGTVRKIVDSWYSLGEVVQRREGTRLKMESELHLWTLYLDESGSLQCYDKMVRAEVSIDCPENIVCQCTSRCPQELYATPAVGGIEARVAVCFDYVLLREEHITSIAGGTLGEPRKRGTTAPSVVLRRGEVGESLWDLAKYYGTTKSEIIAANELDEDTQLPSGMMLIPRVHDA